MDPFIKYNKWMLLFLTALVVIIGLLLCKPRRTDTISKANYDALEQKVKDTAKHYEDMLKADSAAINSAEMASAESREQAEVYRKESAVKQTTIDRLIAKIGAAKSEKPDESWVKVSPNYVEGCDSLVHENVSLKQSNQQYEDQNAETVRLMMYEVSIRDSVLNNEREFNRKFLSQLDNCMLQLKDANKEAQPRNQVFGEIGIIGSKMHPIAGGSAGLTLINKKGQMYGLKGQHIRNELFVEAKTGFKFSFRK